MILFLNLCTITVSDGFKGRVVTERSSYYELRAGEYTYLYLILLMHVGVGPVRVPVCKEVVNKCFCLNLYSFFLSVLIVLILCL